MIHETSILESGPAIVASPNYHGAIVDALEWHRTMLDAALQRFTSEASICTKVAALLIEALLGGHKVLVAGNGGSASEAQHFAAELVGRFKRERSPYAVLSLTCDTAILTAVANDYGYEDVFARQVLALGLPGDVLIAFSTSGESKNLLRAASAAKRCMMRVIAITGNRASRLACLADLAVRVPAADTAITQELHMIVTHVLCDVVESHLAACEQGAGR